MKGTIINHAVDRTCESRIPVGLFGVCVFLETMLLISQGCGVNVEVVDRVASQFVFVLMTLTVVSSQPKHNVSARDYHA